MSADTPTYPLVLVEWIDSRGVSDHWHRAEDTHDTPCPIQSVGWLIRDKPDSITIAPHQGEDPEQYCGDMTIPRCAVQRVTPLIQAKDSAYTTATLPSTDPSGEASITPIAAH